MTTTHENTTSTTEKKAPPVPSGDLLATVPRAELLDIVKYVATTAVPKRPVVPVMAGMLLAGQGGEKMSVAGFDYETFAYDVVDGRASGRALIDGHLLLKVLSKLDKTVATVSFWCETEKLVVEAAGTSYRLPLLLLEDYPAFPAGGGTIAAALPGKELAEVVARVGHAAGKDDTLPVLTCLKLTWANRDLEVAATDRYRLAVETVPGALPIAEGYAASEGEAKVFGSTLKLVAKWFGKSELVTIAFNADAGANGQVSFGDEYGRYLVVESHPGEFPKYASLFPHEQDYRCEAEVGVGDLLAAIGRVEVVMERNTPVRLGVNEAGMLLEAGSKDEASSRTEVPGSLYQGENGGILIAFNPGFMTDALKTFGAGLVRLSMTVPHRPAVLTSAERPNYRVLLMPVKLSG